MIRYFGDWFTLSYPPPPPQKIQKTELFSYSILLNDAGMPLALVRWSRPPDLGSRPTCLAFASLDQPPNFKDALTPQEKKTEIFQCSYFIIYYYLVLFHLNFDLEYFKLWHWRVGPLT